MNGLKFFFNKGKLMKTYFIRKPLWCFAKCFKKSKEKMHAILNWNTIQVVSTLDFVLARPSTEAKLGQNLV